MDKKEQPTSEKREPKQGDPNSVCIPCAPAQPLPELENHESESSWWNPWFYNHTPGRNPMNIIRIDWLQGFVNGISQPSTINSDRDEDKTKNQETKPSE